MRKQDAFTQTLLSQNDKIDQLRNAASSTLERDNASDRMLETEKIKEKYNEILHRHEQLLANCTNKRIRLEDSRNLHLFIRECGEVLHYLTDLHFFSICKYIYVFGVVFILIVYDLY